MTTQKSLLLDLYELTMAQSYLEFKPDSYATFDLLLKRKGIKLISTKELINKISKWMP